MDEDDDTASTASESEAGPDFDYILSMQLWCLTKERKDQILKQRDAKSEDLYKLRKKSPTDLWVDDLDDFEQELKVREEKSSKETQIEPFEQKCKLLDLKR